MKLNTLAPEQTNVHGILFSIQSQQIASNIITLLMSFTSLRKDLYPYCKSIRFTKNHIYLLSRQALLVYLHQQVINRYLIIRVYIYISFTCKSDVIKAYRFRYDNLSVIDTEHNSFKMTHRIWII